LASIYLCYAADNACPFHRLLQPTRFTCPAFERAGHKFDCGEGLPEGYDAYVIHGIPGNLATLVEIGKLKGRGAKFVWSLDDDWLSIPDWNPAKLNADGIGTYHAMRTLADEFLLSTPRLGQVFAAYGKPCHVAPNLLDLGQYPAVDLPPDGKGGKTVTVKLPIRLVWAGGNTHRGDTEVMVEALDRVLRRYDRRQVNVVFFGPHVPPRLVKNHLHRGLTQQPATPFPLYQPTVNSLQPQIWLAPLAEIPFNLAKSNLRVMEGWAMNAAVVATNWGEYSCIKSGEDGRLCSDPDQWFEALTRLVSDHEYRCQMAYSGRQRAESECDWNNPNCRVPWVKAFSAIMGVDRPEDL
jgi:glycosyltransferase involved in cell wall biosynthesis